MGRVAGAPGWEGRDRGRVRAERPRRKFLGLLRDRRVETIVVEHRDRFAGFSAEYVEAALHAQGRRLLVVDTAEADDDLVRDVTEILTSLCARLYGRRAAADRAARAMAVITGDTP